MRSQQWQDHYNHHYSREAANGRYGQLVTQAAESEMLLKLQKFEWEKQKSQQSRHARRS